jgi:hypothetical protein
MAVGDSSRHLVLVPHHVDGTLRKEFDLPASIFPGPVEVVWAVRLTEREL